MCPSLFPRRELKTGTKRTERKRLSLRIDRDKLLVVALSIAVIASFFAGMEVSGKLFSRTVTHTMTFVNIVTKTFIKRTTSTVTITKTVTKTYVPTYVNPRFNVLSLSVASRGSIPALILRYRSNGTVLLRVSFNGTSRLYALSPSNGNTSVTIPIAGPCTPLSNSTVSIVVSSFLGRVLYSANITLGSPRIAASMTQYFLNPSNPHILQRIELQLSNYGSAPAVISKITVLIESKNGNVIAKRTIEVPCIYIDPKRSIQLITPQLYISLPSGKYLVYAYIENSRGEVLFRGEVGTLIIG